MTSFLSPCFFLSHPLPPKVCHNVDYILTRPLFLFFSCCLFSVILLIIFSHSFPFCFYCLSSCVSHSHQYSSSSFFYKVFLSLPLLTLSAASFSFSFTLIYWCIFCFSSRSLTSPLSDFFSEDTTAMSTSSGVDHAVIGGVVAVIVFILLCLLIILGRYLIRHKGHHHLTQTNTDADAGRQAHAFMYEHTGETCWHKYGYT